MVVKFSDIIGQASQGPINSAVFLPQATPPAYGAGVMWYDPNDATMRYYNDSTSGDSIAIGFETNVRVRNTSGSTITAGQVLRITGGTNSRPTVGLAQANSFTNAKVFAIATETILHNSNGYATVSGVIKNINLSAFTVGDELYLSSSTPGAMTHIRPVSPNFAQPLGAVTDASVQGRMIVDFGGRRAIGYGTAHQMLGMKSDGSAPEYKTAAQSRAAILPTMTGQTGKVLGTDGTDAAWITAAAGGGGGLSPELIANGTTAAATNKMYLVNTTAGTATLTLPTGTTEFSMGFLDALETFGTNKLTLTPPSGQSIGTGAVDEPWDIDFNKASGFIYRAAGTSVFRVQYQMTGSGSGSGLTSVETVANVNPAVTGTMYAYGTLTAARTLTLPSGTSAFVIGVVGSASEANSLIVYRGTNTINGAADDDRYRTANFYALYFRAEGSTNVQVARQSSSIYVPEAGRYSPQVTNGSNTAASATASCMYSKAGVIVTVSGNITWQTTGTGTAKIFVALPVASNLTATQDLAGNGSRDSSTAIQPVMITADTANDRAEFTIISNYLPNANVYFTFQYEVK